MSIILIGAPGSGKSTVGRLLGLRLDRDFVDADEVCGDYYAEVGWSVERLTTRIKQVGFEAAHAEWEVALAHAVERLLGTSRNDFIALGAGHTHVTDPGHFERVRAALAAAEAVVLLRPSAASDTTVRILRERCLTSKSHAWHGDGIDWLQRWTTDGRDELLATHTIYNNAERPDQTASRVAEFVRLSECERWSPS